MLDLGLQEALQNTKGTRRHTLRATEATTDADHRPEPHQDGPLERRVSALEAIVASIAKTLSVMAEQLRHVATREDLAVISGKLETKASATDLAELKGRVARIPTVPVLVSILVLISLLFAAASWTVRHLPDTWSRALQ